MADGRKIPYLIELGVTDEKLRQQMSKWDWESILGGKGKGFGDALLSDAKDAKEAVRKTFSGLNIDWTKILGAKEVGQLEQAVTRALSKSRTELELFAKSGDTTGIENTIKYVSALGNELKGLGSSFDADSLARGMSAFMKVLIPLTTKFEALVDEPKKIEAAFDKLFSGISDSAKSVNLGKAFDVSGKIKIAMQGLKATNDEIREATESLEKYRNVVSKLSGDNPATIQLAQDLEGLNHQLDEQMRKEEQLAAQNKTNSVQYAATLKNIMAIENARLKMKAKPTMDIVGTPISQDFDYYEEKINKVIERVSNKISEIESKLADTVDRSFAEVISKQISDIKINLSLSEDSKANLVNTINQYVSDVNKSPLETIKIQIDDVANVIEDQTKRAYGKNTADDDVNTTKLITQTEKRFKGIRGVMYRNQNKILRQTKEWRQQMIEQFKFKSGDFEFKFNNALIEELQTLFDEYGLKINIDPTYLADQIKTVLESSSISLSGGTANIDQASMTAAVMAGVRAALFGEQLPVTTTSTSTQEEISGVTEKVATEIEHTAKHLDIAEEYVRDVVQKIKDVAKYATKHLGTDKDTKGAIATREQFKLLGIDLEKVKLAGDDDAQIAEMLNPLLKHGDFNKLIGSTVIDELSSFKGSSSNTIPAFVSSLQEMFYMLQEDTETVDEWTRKKHSREIFDYARGQARAADSLRNVRSSVRTDKIPDIEYIDKAIAAMSAIGKNTDSLEALRLAREKLGDKTDERSIQEFNEIANDFYQSTTKVFYDLKKQAEDAFKGTIYLQGSKKGIVKKQDIESYKQLARISDNDVILDIRVTSSLNDVALGTTKSKRKNRISPYEEKRLLDGKRGDYIVSPEYEKDILRRELEYGGFRPQGAPTTDVNLGATLEANTKKREVLMAEIKANEEEKKLLREQIDAADKQIADLTAKNDAIPQGRKNATQKKIAEREALSTQLANEIFWLEERVGNGKDGDDKKVGSLTKEIEEQQSRRASAERQLAELSELDVERRKKSLTNKITEIESKDIPGLQQELEKAQIKYRTTDAERGFAQIEALKAQSALKKVPKGKANDEARVAATERVNKANRELARATEVFESASKDVNDITSRIENSKRQIENLQGQISETTLESIRQEQVTRIQTINNAIVSLEEEFAKISAEKAIKEAELLKSNKSLERARNDVVSKTQRELDSAKSAKNNLSTRDKDLDASTKEKQDEVYRLELLNQRVEAEKKYNELQEKSAILQGSIKKMEEDGATEGALSSKRTELDKINEELAEALEKVQNLGGFIAQREVREYSDEERKAYSLEQIKTIDNDLITARAQKNVVAARIAKKDREIAEVDRWGLGAGIGARTLNQEKYKATSEFKNGEYIRSLQEALREQTKASISAAEQYAKEVFDEKVSNAMIKDGMNPWDQKQVGQFLETERGQQYSREFSNQVDADTKELWGQYESRIKSIRDQALKAFKEGIDVDNGVLKYVSKIKDESGEWVNELVEIHVRDALRKRLTDAKEILEEDQAPIQANIDRLYADRKTAIEYGGVGDKEILSADVIEDQIQKEVALNKEKEKRAELQQKISDLQHAGVSDDDESLRQANKELKETDKKIAQYEMLVRNRKKLVELRWEESKADSYTSEEKELHFTDQIVDYNQKIEASLARQEELKKKMESASEEERTNLQYQLSKEEDRVTQWRKSISGYEGMLQKVATTKAAVISTTSSEVSGDIVGAIREVIGSADVDLTPAVEVLKQILAVLTGGQVVENVRSEVAATIDKKSPEWKALKAEANNAYQKAKNTKDKNWTAEEKTAIENTVKSLIEKIQDPKTDEKTKIALQVALKDALSDFANANKGNKDLNYKTRTTKKGAYTWLPYEEMDKYFGLEKGSLNKLRLTNDQAMKKLGGQPIQTQPKTVETGDGGLNAIAREDTLSKILEVLNAFKSEGVKTNGKTKSEEKERTPKKTEAELIRDRAASQKDAVLASAAGKGSLFDKFNQNLQELDDAVAKANAASEKDKAKAIANVKAKAQKVSALSYNILKNTSEWDYIVAQSDSGAKDLKLRNGQSPRDKMERMAKMDAGILGKNGRELKNPKNQYKFLSFDGETLTYQLTDIEGKTRKVTMVWNEFTNQVAITSDKSVSKLDELANKVQSFGEKFKNAIDAGYLADNDADLERFKKKVEEIKTAITDGASFDKINELRNEALRIADEVNKKANKVKRSYSGTNEMNAATRQYGNIEARGILENDDLDKVKDYNKAYSDLIAKHRELSTAGTLYDPENQKTLQNMAIKAKALGKELETAQTRSEDLQQKVANSGLYNGKSIGDMSQVAQGTDLYEQMRAKLEELGATNIKIDRIHQKATGTIRHNNTTVSDLEVAYDELTGSLARYHRQERESLTGVPAFLNGFQKKFNSIMQYLSMTMSIHRIISEVRRGVQYVREIDKALTELKKVTDETEETYDKFLKTAAKTGERLGSTISAVTEATATFAKLGYSMEQASEMAEAAIVYKNVGDNIASTEDAADSIISTLKGFGLEASESMAIVDKFNEVGNSFAITSQGIGEALRLSASALNEGKNSLDESIAMITAANEVVNDPSSVGTALKTLTLRLRGSKTELEEMGEDVSDMATTTSQLQAKLLALTGGQVDIMLDEN